MLENVERGIVEFLETKLIYWFNVLCILILMLRIEQEFRRRGAFSSPIPIQDSLDEYLRSVPEFHTINVAGSVHCILYLGIFFVFYYTCTY